MADEDQYEREYWDNGGLKSQKPKAKADAASKAAVADRMKATDLGSKGKAVSSDAPKQEAGETPAQFAKRFREYREARAKK